MIGTAEDAQVLRQMPGDSGMWNLIDSVLFMVYFFSFRPCPYPCIDLLSLFPLYVLCSSFETRVPTFCYLSCWVSPKEHFGDILRPVRRAGGFNYSPSPQEAGGDGWKWCLNHQELTISLRKPLHGTFQELSWLWYSPRRDVGEFLDPSCCFGGISSSAAILTPLPCSSSHMDGTLGNSDC